MTREDNNLTDSRGRHRGAVNVLAEVPNLADGSCMHENEARHDTEVQSKNDSQEAETQTPGLAIRRSPIQRRTDGRPRSDRRRVERRRRRIRTLLLVAVTAGIPGAWKGPATFGLFPGVAVSVDRFQAVPADKAYDDLIREAAQTYALDEDLIRAVIRAESSFDPLQVSPAGAKGLMQIMPVLAKELGVSDPFDPRQNIMAGAGYLRRLLDKHSGNVALALASYNAGPTNVARYKGMPPFRETRNYVRKIKGYLADAETLDTD
jgi:soluble lytic murein transglycosylase-like protein